MIWITGASSGIGEHLAVALSRTGARLILSARDARALERVRGSCRDADQVCVLPLDLEDNAALPGKVRDACALFGRIDILVNNAGVAVRDFALATSSDVDRHLMMVNYLGPVALTKAVLPAMLERGTGQVVTVTSLSGKFGVPRAAAYAASKHALHGFIDSVRVELRGRGVTFTTIIPGVIRTAITAHAVDGAGTPTGRLERTHEEGMSAERCAALMVRAIAAGKAEVFVGGGERFLLPFRRLLPGMFYRFLGSHPVRRVRSLKAIFRRDK